MTTKLKSKSRVLMLFGKNYSFTDTMSGRLVEGAKITFIDDFMDDGKKDGNLSDICEGFPVLVFGMKYKDFLQQFRGFGVYDVYYEYNRGRDLKLHQSIKKIVFVSPYILDHKEGEDSIPDLDDVENF